MQPQQYQYPPQAAPQGYAPQPQAAPNGAPVFTSPIAPGGGEKAPRPRDMVGCLVAYSPKLLTPAGAPGNTEGVGGSPARDRITADLFILKTPMGPITFGGSPEYERDPKPHTHTVAGPARFSGVWVSNSNIVKALAPNGQVLAGAMVLGIIERSTVGNLPFNLVDVAGTPAMNEAIAIWSALQIPGSGTAYNEPQPLPGFAPAAPNSVQYAAPQPQPQMAPQAQAPAYGWPQNVPVPQQQYAPPAQQGYGAPAQQVNQWAGAPVAPVQVPVSPEPPPHLAAMGWTAQTWVPLTDAQKSQVLAANPA
jgi:hypothetical protein